MPKQHHRNKSRLDYISLGCCVLAFLLYVNTLNAGFVYDDRRAILGNLDVIGNRAWHHILHDDFWGTPLSDSGSHGSYRPLCVLTFRLNYLLGGLKPIGYHAVNVFLHCIATLLVIRLARQMLPRGPATTIAGLLFATHPVHTEAVAGVVGRADILATVFYLLTLLMYIKHVKSRERGGTHALEHFATLMATIVAAVAAILCKETAVTALLVCGIYDVIRGLTGTRDKARYRSLTILAIAFAITVHFRLSLPQPKQDFSTADNPTAKSNSLWTRFFTFAYLPVFNFKLLLYPSKLSFDWGMDAIPRITSPFDSRNFLSCLFYAILLRTIWSCIAALKREMPTVTQLRMSRAVKKRSQQLWLQQQQQYTMQSLHHPVVNEDCVCTICKHSQMVRHSSSCRAINNNNVPQVACGCSTSADILPNFNKVAHSTPSTSRDSSSSAYESEERHKGAPRMSSSAVILVSLALIALPFLPATNIFFYVGFVVAERILYLPSVGYCLLVAMGFSKLIGTIDQPSSSSSTASSSKQKHHHHHQQKYISANQKNNNIMVLKTLNNNNNKINHNSANHNNNMNNKILISCICIIVIVYSVRTIDRNFDWRSEESLYRSAIGINPPKALGNLGSVLSSQGRYNEAKVALMEALKYRPNMADVHYNLGILLQNQQDYKGAVDSFQKAIHFRPSLALAYLNLGTSLIALGRCQEAANVLRDGSSLDGTGLRDRTAHDNARIASLLQLGGLYAEQGKLQRALAVYREALHNLPESYPPQGIYHRLGDVLAKLHQWSEAERFQLATLDAQPDHLGAHISYGKMLARNNSRISEAEHWFKRALKLAPNDASVHHHYAEFLHSLNRIEEACQSRIKAAELSPNDYSLVVAAATSLRLLDRKTEAEKWYRLAVLLRPNDARAHTNLGAILHLMGRGKQATASYKEALRLQPGDPTTMANLAKLSTSA
ncbi:protein O-mannosyl-transferase TMTC2 [Culicoides brevitarsis]|uniref:protein O-mannosyl-transferase TMTC2 n=1 Tax=Culicoides brevitarsis TaxID=469753 RepID=UPI00307B78D7